jgi:WD40 repeat protein
MVLISLELASPVWAYKPAKSSRSAVICQSSTWVIIQSSMESASLYDYATGRRLRDFNLGEAVGTLAVSIDEQYLLLAGQSGSARVWQIVDGKELTAISLAGESINDVSFSGDGSKFCVACMSGAVAIFRTVGGVRIAEFQLNDSAMTSSLSTDGSLCLVIDQRNCVFAVDVVDKKIRPWSVRGTWPLRLTKDGCFAVMVSADARSCVQIIEVQSQSEIACSANLAVERVHSLADGSTLITGIEGTSRTEVGIRFDPAKRSLEQLWRLSVDVNSHSRGMDFDPRVGIGVTTDYRLVTRIINLKDGSVGRVFDNSEYYSEPTRPSALLSSPTVWTCGIALVFLLWLLICLLARNRGNGQPC